MKRLSLLRLAGPALAVAALGLPGASRAQAPSNKAAADVLFDQGKKLMGESRFAEACPKLAESQKLDPAPGTLIWLADCYEKNGQTASSWSTYREALAAAKAAGQAQRETLARERIEVLEKLLSTITLQVADRSLAGLEIKIDGQPIGQVLWGTPIPYDPGPHTVEATAPNHAAYQSKTALGKDGAKLSIDVPRLTPSAAPPPTASTRTATPPPTASAPPATNTTTEPPPSNTLRTAGYILGGGGVLLGGVGAILAITARSAAQQAIDDCKDHVRCTQGDIDNHDSARTRNTAGLVLAGIGGALAVGGAVLVFTSPGETRTGKAWLSPQVGKSFSGVSLGGSF